MPPAGGTAPARHRDAADPGPFRRAEPLPEYGEPDQRGHRGLHDIHTPNTRGGTRRSASNSSQYGITDDSSPIAAP